MVHAQNYETVSTFVKVMQKKNRGLFFRTRCRPTYINILDEDFGFHVAWLLLHKQSALYS